MENIQKAPYPVELEKLVKGLKYRPGWEVFLEYVDRGQGSEGLTLKVLTFGYNTYRPSLGSSYRVWHFFPVPPAAYNKQSWQRWLFEQFLLVERHEAAEFFRIDGKRVYAPHHGPGNDPYIIWEHGNEKDIHISYKGEDLSKVGPNGDE